MRTRYTIATVTALALAGTLSLSAQTPQTPQTPQAETPQTAPPSQRPTMTPPDAQRPAVPEARSAASQTVTVTGCLKEEKDVPGRNQSAAVRGHMDNDYVLTNVKMAEGSTTSGIGLASMYEIKGLDSQLKAHLGHQVEVTGTLDANAKMPASATSDITDLNGTSVKMLAQTCSSSK